jgi:imidazolonepropionase-like amidohydrolase
VRVRASRLVVGAGREVITNGQVVFAGGIIEAVQRAGEKSCQDEVLAFDFGDATITPGLIDPHVHLSLRLGEDLEVHAAAPLEKVCEHAARISQQLLSQGVTTVRDLGCRADMVWELQCLRWPGCAGGAGPIAEPAIGVLIAGPPVTSRRGHFWPIGIEVAGSAEAAAATRVLTAQGSDVIKVMVTGGSTTPGTRMGHAQLDLAEVTAVVDAAHAAGKTVAAHAHGTEGIAIAVLAGVDTIEHCSWTDTTGAVTEPAPALLDAMAATGQSIVTAGPLRPDLVTWVRTGRLPDTAATRRQLALWANARRAHEHGVNVTVGTDAMFGAMADNRELAARLAGLTELAGFDRLDAIELATGNAARALGAGRLGVLRPSASADIAVFPGDLTADLRGLTAPLAVWKRGISVKIPDRQDAGCVPVKVGRAGHQR